MYFKLLTAWMRFHLLTIKTSQHFCIVVSPEQHQSKISARLDFNLGWINYSTGGFEAAAIMNAQVIYYRNHVIYHITLSWVGWNLKSSGDKKRLFHRLINVGNTEY